MTKAKKNSKKTKQTDVLAPVTEALAAEAPKAVQKLDVSKVEVASSSTPPSRRLFPTSLLAELDSIKARLDELEKKLK